MCNQRQMVSIHFDKKLEKFNFFNFSSNKSFGIHKKTASSVLFFGKNVFHFYHLCMCKKSTKTQFPACNDSPMTSVEKKRLQRQGIKFSTNDDPLFEFCMPKYLGY